VIVLQTALRDQSLSGSFLASQTAGILDTPIGADTADPQVSRINDMAGGLALNAGHVFIT
jgi:hypothetical protein